MLKRLLKALINHGCISPFVHVCNPIVTISYCLCGRFVMLFFSDLLFIQTTEYALVLMVNSNAIFRNDNFYHFSLNRNFQFAPVL